MSEQNNTAGMEPDEATTDITVEPSTEENTTEHSPHDDHDDGRRLVGEAKKYRQRAQAAEAERDKLQKALTAARGIILTDYIRKAGMLHPEDF
ncbi:hypothetical protein H6A14_08720, partial [Bifidobacterium pullorum subsp. saeculare]|uniref:hypothetical protein n=2 Tax=Bifidobacterium TaxID=1678 RepID=UPI00195B8D62